MSALEQAIRIILVLARNPTVQSAAKHVLRTATAELIRQVRHRSRAGTVRTRIS